ncbi:MAG: PDDEXK nuclease domain-containing protein, partial [Candidatus Margulisiibacteriota bacterium]
ERLAKDLQRTFPGTAGYSQRNLWDMRRFYEGYKKHAFLRQAVAEIPWGHNLVILNKTGHIREREYYIKASAQFGWSRNVLLNQIKSRAYERQLAKPKQHNFRRTLPANFSEQAEETMKSIYNLDFLGLGKPIKERELENRLVKKVKQFILELGYGFSFIGNQYRLTLDNKEYFIDLLFYNRLLKCLVAIELKTGEFEPEYAGKMDFYLHLLNDRVKLQEENPSIGIILCAEKSKLVVEYALRSVKNPVGVAEYQLTSKLPKDLEGKLPSVADLRANVIWEGLGV